MKKILYVFTMTVIALLPFATSAWAIDDFTLTVNTIPDIEEEQAVIIQGSTIDLEGIPVSGVGIAVVLPSESIETTTNSTGQFSVSSTKTTELGTYLVTIYARKDNKVASTSTDYSVIDIQSKPIPELKSIQDISNDTLKQQELDSFSKMLKEMEKQKTMQAKNDTNTKQHQIINEQRKHISEDLQQDLTSLRKENESHNPHNAFLSFLSNINSAVKDIFWHQFLFTEDLVTQAQTAKQNALEDGKTSLEATKSFQEIAAVSQKEIMEFNEKVNIEYENSTSVVQGQFDSYGKVPRE